MDDRDEVIKDLLIGAASVLPQFWRNRVRMHMSEACDWKATNPELGEIYRGIKCVTHDVEVMPPPIEIHQEMDRDAVQEQLGRINSVAKEVGLD